VGLRVQETLYGNEIFQGFTADALLFEGQTPYQKVDIYATKRWGKVLVLDGIIQTTEADEFVYHEMLTHVPMFGCANPRRVMIVGGGDGGILREVLKHDIEHVDMVEIDRTVVDYCIEHMPTLNDAGRIYSDPRASLVIEDAFEFIKREKNRYDVILVDSTDPVGAAEVLFSETFYHLCRSALNPGGVLALQDGVPFLQPEEAKGSMNLLRSLGLLARCYAIAVPTYYGGNMALGYASDDRAVMTPQLETVRARFEKSGMSTRHYTPELHVASFVLPRWMQENTGGLA
jgi:spermidine synthase